MADIEVLTKAVKSAQNQNHKSEITILSECFYENGSVHEFFRLRLT